jgi:hypothetical protein
VVALLVMIWGSAFLSAGSFIASLMWCLAHTSGQPRLRIVGWFAIGVAGLPALALYDAYLFGFPASLAVFWVSAGFARWRSVDYALVGLLAGLVAAAFALDADLWSSGWLLVSSVCAVTAIMKLGRSFGRGTLWAEYFERRASPMPAVRR